MTDRFQLYEPGARGRAPGRTIEAACADRVPESPGRVTEVACGPGCPWPPRRTSDVSHERPRREASAACRTEPAATYASQPRRAGLHARLEPRLRAQLGHGVGEPGAHRPDRDPELAGDHLVGDPLAGQPQHLYHAVAAARPGQRWPRGPTAPRRRSAARPPPRRRGPGRSCRRCREGAAPAGAGMPAASDPREEPARHHVEGADLGRPPARTGPACRAGRRSPACGPG